jgi:hypothetical protein
MFRSHTKHTREDARFVFPAGMLSIQDVIAKLSNVDNDAGTS